ncbi:LysR family transcriptional regulator [Sulfitobacter sp. S190]|uniref:LysR family transcriptional regulator n=1 Tax=Sulfitobacter sp. S190 TaxID=2867022 RepID=UPI0021A30C53|nr:LysR family transcriptional regulator [Sulfitobacter sp. S190]UWR24536.1 LysR family transcriptional regulator [Sulfitobacter sp. S190]
MAGQIEKIRTFIAVADHRGFAAAARSLNVSPTAVTRQIADLEDYLGAQLFLRTTRQVNLTDAGRIYYDAVVPISEHLAVADDKVLKRQIGLVGPLRVSAPLSFGIRYLPAVMSQFRTLHPAVSVDLQLSDRMVDIGAESFDMALRISGPPEGQSTIWRKICEVPRGLMAHPDYIARRGAPDTPRALADHDCLHYGNQRSRMTWTLQNSGGSVQVTVDPCLASNSGDLLAQLAGQGEGIVMLPTFLTDELAAQGALVPVLPDWAPPPIWLTATFPPYEQLPARVDAFTRFVEAEMTRPD